MLFRSAAGTLAAFLGLVGAALAVTTGVLLAIRRAERPNDATLALRVDERLKLDERFVTALALEAPAAPVEATAGGVGTTFTAVTCPSLRTVSWTEKLFTCTLEVASRTGVPDVVTVTVVVVGPRI